MDYGDAMVSTQKSIYLKKNFPLFIGSYYFDQFLLTFLSLKMFFKKIFNLKGCECVSYYLIGD